MRWTATGCVLAILVLATTAAAQPGVGLSTTPAPRPLDERPPAYAVPGPNDTGVGAGRSDVGYDPVFIGPTLKTGRGELGASAWIAPNPPLGGRQAGWRDVSGWAAFGLTFSWGGPPHRPSPGGVFR
jgi:hypothetical protein